MEGGRFLRTSPTLIPITPVSLLSLGLKALSLVLGGRVFSAFKARWGNYKHDIPLRY